MQTLLFRVIRASTFPHFNTWNHWFFDRSLYYESGYIETPVPENSPVNKSIYQNDYLIDLKNHNVEILRTVAQNIVQAEIGLGVKGVVVAVMVVYLELDKKIGPDCASILLMPINADLDGHPNQASYLNHNKQVDARIYSPKNPQQMRTGRHHLRGSGRYYPVRIEDAPRFAYQAIRTPGVFPQYGNTIDNYLGLSVAFPRLKGKALRRVYFGCVNDGEYYLNTKGKIVFRQDSDIFKKRFNDYRASILPIFPLFSKNKLNDEGVLVEAEPSRFVAEPVATIISEYSAIRRAAYTKGGNGEEFKSKLYRGITRYQDELYNLLNDIQDWGHNLNYDVNGFQRTRWLHIYSESLIRLIQEYFPQQLNIPANMLSRDTKPFGIPKEKTLLLGNRGEEVSICFDQLVKESNWMRQNWIEYILKERMTDLRVNVEYPSLNSNSDYSADYSGKKL